MDCQTATSAPIVQLSRAGACRNELLLIVFENNLLIMRIPDIKTDKGLKHCVT